MPVIGATELQPVNILGSYVQGLEGGRAARSQRLQEQAALVQAQREAELRNYLSTADLSSPEAQNQLLRYGKSGADIAKTLGEMATQKLTREKTGLEIKDLDRKARLDASGRLTSMLRSALKKPEDYPVLLRMAEAQGYDISEAPPTFDATWLNSKLAEALGVEKSLIQEDREAQARRDVDRLKLEKRRVAVSEATERRVAGEASDKSIVARTETAADGTVRFYNKFGDLLKTEKGAGKPSATFERSKLAREQAARDISYALTTLKEVTKKGGLIEQSTGSGIGRGVDITLGLGGIATPGSIAIAKLQPLADTVLKIVPRFEGPQSDADRQSYNEASGQLANPLLPVAQRLEAGKTLIELFTRRQGQFTTAGAETETGGDWQDL